MSSMITLKGPLNHERSMKYNLFHFQRLVLDKAPHLAIAIFNNNSIGELALLESGAFGLV